MASPARAILFPAVAAHENPNSRTTSTSLVGNSRAGDVEHDTSHNICGSLLCRKRMLSVITCLLKPFLLWARRSGRCIRRFVRRIRDVLRRCSKARVWEKQFIVASICTTCYLALGNYLARLLFEQGSSEESGEAGLTDANHASHSDDPFFNGGSVITALLLSLGATLWFQISYLVGSIVDLYYPLEAYVRLRDLEKLDIGFQRLSRHTSIPLSMMRAELLRRHAFLQRRNARRGREERRVERGQEISGLLLGRSGSRGSRNFEDWNYIPGQTEQEATSISGLPLSSSSSSYAGNPNERTRTERGDHLAGVLLPSDLFRVAGVHRYGPASYELRSLLRLIGHPQEPREDNAARTRILVAQQDARTRRKADHLLERGGEPDMVDIMADVNVGRSSIVGERDHGTHLATRVLEQETLQNVRGMGQHNAGGRRMSSSSTGSASRAEESWSTHPAVASLPAAVPNTARPGEPWIDGAGNHAPIQAQISTSASGRPTNGAAPVAGPRVATESSTARIAPVAEPGGTRVDIDYHRIEDHRVAAQRGLLHRLEEINGGPQERPVDLQERGSDETETEFERIFSATPSASRTPPVNQLVDSTNLRRGRSATYYATSLLRHVFVDRLQCCAGSSSSSSSSGDESFHLSDAWPSPEAEESNMQHTRSEAEESNIHTTPYPPYPQNPALNSVVPRSVRAGTGGILDHNLFRPSDGREHYNHNLPGPGHGVPDPRAAGAAGTPQPQIVGARLLLPHHEVHENDQQQHEHPVSEFERQRHDQQDPAELERHRFKRRRRRVRRSVREEADDLSVFRCLLANSSHYFPEELRDEEDLREFEKFVRISRKRLRLRRGWIGRACDGTLVALHAAFGAALSQCPLLNRCSRFLARCGRCGRQADSGTAP
ncbi:unnamed protein product [Amoebophrya sp. A25]|nr:unnamed protein product [Amoebophrya sp. A25]|eukprot:GSA25T00010571001.1